MIDSTLAQARLHPDLVGPEAARVIELARDAEAKRALLREVQQEDASFKVIPIRLSRGGLRVWKTESNGPGLS